jgi:S-layer protein
VPLGSSNGAIKWFQYGGNTYITEILTNNGTVADAASTDLVVKLVGTIDLSTSLVAGTNVITLA